jgi:hypothetical protein
MTEATFAAGRPSDPRRGRMTFTTYLETIWFPNHVLEPSTRQSYRYLLDLKRPGTGRDSEPTGEWSSASTQEVPQRVA